MTTKQLLLDMVRKLPADASVEDAMARLLLLAKVQKGIRQADTGETIPHERVKATMRRWLK